MNQTIYLPQENIKLTLNVPGTGTAAGYLEENEPKTFQSAGEVRIINLVVDLPLAGSIRANCYGQSPEGTHAEFLSCIKITRNNLYNGCQLENGRLVYREQLYLDTSNDETLQVIAAILP